MRKILSAFLIVIFAISFAHAGVMHGGVFGIDAYDPEFRTETVGTSYRGNTRSGIDAAITAGAKSVELTGNITLAAHWDLSAFTGRFSTNGHQISGAFTFTAPADFVGSDNCFGVTTTVVGLREARPEWWGTGSTAIQLAVNSLTSGTVWAPGAYTTDTITMKTGVTLDLMGSGVLTFTAHATTHNPVILMGNLASAISKAGVRNGKISGNMAGQTGAGDQFSPGIMIWGSDECLIENMEITDCQGDGITIGYDSGRVVGSNRNVIRNCEIYANKSNRQAIAITNGSENIIEGNRCTGNIDIELNNGIGEAKDNIIINNTGRVTAGASETVPRISDLVITLASLNTERGRYYGNLITGNVCSEINGGNLTDGTKIVNNTVIGSNATQARLINLDACDNCNVSSNTLRANSTVATGLTDILRTRACRYLNVTNNIVANEAVIFHMRVATYGDPAETELKQYFFGNVRSGTGTYRSGNTERVSEWALYRIDQVNGGDLTLTQVGGVPDTMTATRDAGDATKLRLTSAGAAGLAWKFRIWPQCNATTAASADMTDNCAYTYTTSTVHRIITMYTFTPSAAAVSLSAFSFASDGGTGTFWVEVWF